MIVWSSQIWQSRKKIDCIYINKFTLSKLTKHFQRTLQHFQWKTKWINHKYIKKKKQTYIDQLETGKKDQPTPSYKFTKGGLQDTKDYMYRKNIKKEKKTEKNIE